MSNDINIDISQVSQNLDGLTERLLQQIGIYRPKDEILCTNKCTLDR